MGKVQKHFVTFYSPGTFTSETSSFPVDSWNIGVACDMAHDVTERYGATPYGFQFSTRTRSKVSAKSPFYHLGGKIETFAEVEARNAPNEEILRSNMKSNGYDRIVVNDNSYRSTRPLGSDDVVLDWAPKKRGKVAGE
jgi:hypothetical protein